MLRGEYPENFVGKRLPDRLHAAKIENHRLESVNSGEQPFGLRARYQIFVPVLRQLYRHNGFREAVTLSRGKLVEHLLRGSRRVIVQFHPHRRSGREPVSFQYPVLFLVELVRKMYASRQDFEVIEHPRGKKDSLARVASGL